MKTIVFYHRADFDGIFSYQIAKKALGDSATYIGWDYGDPVPTVDEGDNLYMIDISIEPLMNHPGLIWIDHHKSAIEKYQDVAGWQLDGVAACRLAWQYFFELGEGSVRLHNADFFHHRVKEPLAVRLAGEYDIWDKRDPRAELFQHGLRSTDLANLWPFLLEDGYKPTQQEIDGAISTGYPEQLEDDGCRTNGMVFGLLRAGEAIQYAKANENEGIIKSFGYDIDWHGLKFLAVNHARFNSHLFKAGLKPEHDACLGYVWDGQNKHYRVSLYGVPGKPEVDLAKIAVEYGGGGHKQACGFTCEKTPWFPAPGGGAETDIVIRDMPSDVSVLPDGSAFFTAEVMSKEEAMALPIEKRPLNHRIPGNLYHAVFEAIGSASMCWQPRPGDQVFDSEQASKVAVELCFKIAAELENPTPLA